MIPKYIKVSKQKLLGQSPNLFYISHLQSYTNSKKDKDKTYAAMGAVA